jgi:Fe-S cluster assembly protein SufD
MEFKEKLLSSHFALDENIEIFESVQQIRAEALKVFEKKGFPSKKEESWKYTSLQGLIRSDYAIFPKAEKNYQNK